MKQIWLDGLFANTHPVVKAVEVGVEALVVPPTAVGDFSADVSTVGGAEALLVMVPTERVLNSSTEAWHMQAVLVLLVLHATNTQTWAVITAGINSNSSQQCLQPPESLVEGMFVLVAPVLQVDPEAVLSLGAQLVYVFVAQPELWVQVAETIPVVPPIPVKAHWPVDTPLDHSPASTWGAEEASLYQRTVRYGGCSMTFPGQAKFVVQAHHPCPCHSKPPEAWRPVMGRWCRAPIFWLHCNRWRHSLWGSSSHAEHLTEHRRAWVPTSCRHLYLCKSMYLSAELLGCSSGCWDGRCWWSTRGFSALDPP